MRRKQSRRGWFGVETRDRLMRTRENTKSLAQHNSKGFSCLSRSGPLAPGNEQVPHDVGREAKKHAGKPKEK